MRKNNALTRRRAKTVLAFGTFDILHPGHLAYLRQARRLGDKLIVVIARDATVRSIKKRAPLFHEKDRRDIVNSLRIVSKAYLGAVRDHISIIRKLRPDVICLGYDQKISVNALKNILRTSYKGGIKIVRAKPHRVFFYKSSRYRAV